MSDLEDLRRLVSDYNMFGDRFMLAQMGALFGEDGVLETADWKAVGAAGVQKQLGGGSEGGAGGERRALFVRHNLTTSQFDIVDGQNARGRHYFFVVSDSGPDHMGVYVDRYHRVNGGWRFAHRHVQIDWVSENSASYARLWASIPARRKRG